MLLLLMLSAVAGASQEPDPDSNARREMAMKMMEAGFHLNGVYDKDMDARVPVEALNLPESALRQIDTNGDGVITFDEYEAMSRRGAGGPVEPADRSAFTSLKDGGYPLNLDPEIVAAEDCDIGDDDLVMGVVVNGEARAYPVNYMNGPYNEVVNDKLGGQAIAPSW